MRPILLPLTLLLICCAPVIADNSMATASGQELMNESFRRHQQYPYVYEEQSMILVDGRGNREARKLKRYSRLAESGEASYLLLFDSPAEVKGVAMLARRTKDGETQQSFYLPAFGPVFFDNGDSSSHTEENFLGTDYSIENLIGETLDDSIQVRRDDVVIDETPYFVVDILSAKKSASDGASETGSDDEQLLLRTHYILQEQLFVSRTDHFDELGRLRKRQTGHDLINVHGDMWRANMMMMENSSDNHRTIIKINKRVFSADYVPAEVFTPEWIFENQEPEPLETYAVTEDIAE